MKIFPLKFVEGLRRLSDNLPRIENVDFEASLVRSKIASGEIDFKSALRTQGVLAWKQFRDDIVIELNAAVAIGQEQSIELPNCRKLSIALAQGYYNERSRLTLESIAELDSCVCKLEATKPKRSRQEPDKHITIWYREHGHKYANNKKAAVKAYADLHGGDETKHYSDLHNQRNRLKPKKTS